MTISILGTAITDFGELWNRSLEDLLREASFGAIESAGLDPKKIDAVFVANMAAGSFGEQRHLGALVSSFFSHFPPATRIEGACASGGLALLAAEDALVSGRYETVLVVGAEKMTDVPAAVATKILATAADARAEYGSTFPGLYALLTQSHTQQYGTTREMLSAVSAKNHAHAITNPHAQFHKAISLEQVSASPFVAEPLRLLDCSPLSDGAAAVVLSTKRAKANAQIISAGHGMDSLSLAGRASLTSLMATKRAAKTAFSQANLKPSDIDTAEVHDCFTIAELLALEDLGFCAAGEAGRATLAGHTTRSHAAQKIVINPSGGLKACGHPVGATGIKQVAYLAELIAKKESKFALAHNVGGSGATAVVHVLTKSERKQ